RRVDVARASVSFAVTVARIRRSILSACRPFLPIFTFTVAAFREAILMFAFPKVILDRRLLCREVCAFLTVLSVSVPLQGTTRRQLTRIRAVLPLTRTDLGLMKAARRSGSSQP